MAQNEFSNGTAGGYNTLQGGRWEQAPTLTSIYVIDGAKVPTTFPMAQWSDQISRYQYYWSWFNGDFLNESKKGPDGQTLYRFPLRINTLRDVVRKHCSVLFGEAPDGPMPLVDTSIKARNNLLGDSPTDDQKKFAKLCESIVRETWFQSNGRATQQEGGELTQFLGGHYFQLAYVPWNKDLQIPIEIRSWKADMVLPVWSNGNYWDLSEAYIVCRIESAVAKNQYGIESSGGFSVYVEHWTREKYSVYIDGKPITLKVKGAPTKFEDLPNPFGFVPIYYIPHLREGSFFGSSHVPDLSGLVQEYNAAMANMGDAISESIDRTRYIRNSSQRTKVELPNGKEAINLGMQNPSASHPPDAWTEDPPQLTEGLTNYPNSVYQQIRRTAFMPAVAEGEDEGSQRSGVTLDIRFWAATAHAKAERSFWETGLNLMARGILKIIHEKQLWDKFLPGITVPDNFLAGLYISQDWFPQIPRDRASQVNEILARYGSHTMSLDEAIRGFGDIEDPDSEKDLIREDMAFEASLSATNKETGAPINPLASNDFAKASETLD